MERRRGEEEKRRRGEGERTANCFLSKLPKKSTLFRVTPNVAAGPRQQQEPEAAVSSTAVSVSRGGDEAERDTGTLFITNM